MAKKKAETPPEPSHDDPLGVLRLDSTVVLDPTEKPGVFTELISRIEAMEKQQTEMPLDQLIAALEKVNEAVAITERLTAAEERFRAHLRDHHKYSEDVWK